MLFTICFQMIENLIVDARLARKILTNAKGLPAIAYFI